MSTPLPGTVHVSNNLNLEFLNAILKANNIVPQSRVYQIMLLRSIHMYL